MKSNLRRNIAIVATLAAGIISVFYYFKSGATGQNNQLVAQVKKGDFTVAINASGELAAKKSVEIMGPQGVNAFGVYQFKISSIVPEGSAIKQGDFVAALDGSELIGKMKDRQSDFERAMLQYTQATIDTSLELRQARDELINLKFAQEEKQLILKQSIYEPPATIRQAEIDYDKSKRAYIQATDNYKIKLNKAIAKVQEAKTNVDKAQRAVEAIQKVLNDFTISAPADGIVVYFRDWRGQKRREGSSVDSWYPVVATLPDLSIMISRTFVNEVDIQKIKVGQTVSIGLDAFPDKKFNGKVANIANIGEQRPNSDSKVFEVEIEVSEKDSTLLPAMTTSNLILAEVIKDALIVPLEAIFSEGKVTYAIKKQGSGLVRQEIRLGKTNENAAVVLAGLAENDEVLLSLPANANELALERLPDSKTNEKQLSKK